MLHVAGDARGFAGQPAEYRGHDSQDRVRGYDEGEGALYRSGIESRLGAQGRLDPQQRFANRLDQRQAARSELHVPPDPDQQLVIEVFAQLLQGGAHGGLGDEDALGSPGDVLFVDQGVQGNEEVEVETVQLHGKIGSGGTDVVFGVARGTFRPQIR